MTNFVAIVILVVILGVAIGYIIKEKKKGTKCIGCPAACSCSHRDNPTGCSCQSDN